MLLPTRRTPPGGGIGFEANLSTSAVYLFVPTTIPASGTAQLQKEKYRKIERANLEVRFIQRISYFKSIP
jgi:hypothetical protein